MVVCVEVNLEQRRCRLVSALRMIQSRKDRDHDMLAVIHCDVTVNSLNGASGNSCNGVDREGLSRVEVTASLDVDSKKFERETKCAPRQHGPCTTLKTAAWQTIS